MARILGLGSECESRTAILQQGHPTRLWLDRERGIDRQQHTWFRKLETQAGRCHRPILYRPMDTNDPRTFNRYAYVEGDPVNRTDPSGLCSVVDGSRLGLDCFVNVTVGSSGGVAGGGGIGGSISARSPETKCFGATCGGGPP